MKKVHIIIILFLINIQSLFSKTPADIIKQINSFFELSKTLKGDFVLYEGKRLSKGYFLFKAPHFFKMVYGLKKGNEINKKRIISDGKRLWVYLPRSHYVIDQDLKTLGTEKPISAQILGILRFKSNYNFKFEHNDSSFKIRTGLKEKTYLLRLESKNKSYGFKKLLFYVREDGFIIKTVAETYNNKKTFILIRKNVQINPEIKDKEFRRVMPKNTRVIKNPFVSGRGY